MDAATGAVFETVGRIGDGSPPREGAPLGAARLAGVPPACGAVGGAPPDAGATRGGAAGGAGAGRCVGTPRGAVGATADAGGTKGRGAAAMGGVGAAARAPDAAKAAGGTTNRCAGGAEAPVDTGACAPLPGLPAVGATIVWLPVVGRGGTLGPPTVGAARPAGEGEVIGALNGGVTRRTGPVGAVVDTGGIGEGVEGAGRGGFGASPVVTGKDPLPLPTAHPPDPGRAGGAGGMGVVAGEA